MQWAAKSVLPGVLIGLLITSMVVRAQPERHNQLLFRSGNALYLADAVTGEITEIFASESGHTGWSWSPDGHYIMARVTAPNAVTNEQMLQVYDLDAGSWLEDLNIITNSARWLDSRHILFAVRVDMDMRGELYLFDLQTRERQILYQTPDSSDPMRPWAVTTEGSSQYENHLLFVDYQWQIGGSTNYLNLLNLTTGQATRLYGAYYGSYQPQWSPDGRWVLVRLEQHYSPPAEPDGEYGDVFVFSVPGGAKYQITATPEIKEIDPHWSSDGKFIQFSTNDDGYFLHTIEFQPTAPQELPQATVQPMTPAPRIAKWKLDSPDGQHVAYLETAVSGERYTLFVSESDGANVYRLGEVRDRLSIFGWRP